MQTSTDFSVSLPRTQLLIRVTSQENLSTTSPALTTDFSVSLQIFPRLHRFFRVFRNRFFRVFTKDTTTYSGNQPGQPFLLPARRSNQRKQFTTKDAALILHTAACYHSQNATLFMPYFSFIAVEQLKTFESTPLTSLMVVSFAVCWTRQLGSSKVSDHTFCFSSSAKSPSSLLLR